MGQMQMEEGVATFDVSESATALNAAVTNIANRDQKGPFSHGTAHSRSVYDLESAGSDSPLYEDFVDFDPSNFRLTPETTISPKREACLSSEFKSVDTYESLVVLSVKDCEEEDNVSLYRLEDDLVIKNNDSVQGDDTPQAELDFSIDNAHFREDDSLVTEGFRSQDQPLPNNADHESSTNLIGDELEGVEPSLLAEVNAGTVSFDVGAQNREFVDAVDRNDSEEPVSGSFDLGSGETKGDSGECAGGDEETDGRESLDSVRLMTYLKNERVTEICRRLRADLKGTKQLRDQDLQEGQVPFSERVYNYIADLRAYSTLSSQDPSSRLTSLDFNALDVGGAAALEDFEDAPQSPKGSPHLPHMYDSATEASSCEFLGEVGPDPSNLQVENKRDQHAELERGTVHYASGNTLEHTKYGDRALSGEVDYRVVGSLEEGLEDLKGSSFIAHTGALSHLSTHEGYDLHNFVLTKEFPPEKGILNYKDWMSEEDPTLVLGKQLPLDLGENRVLETGKKRKQLETMAVDQNYEDGNDVHATDSLKHGFKSRKVDDQPKPTNMEVSERAEEWHGLDCMLSRTAVNLVYNCLRSVKVSVGQNLHEYDVYSGTKRLMHAVLDLLRTLNTLEKKLRADFIELEKNDFGLELTRSTYLTLVKENTRLQGLLSSYKACLNSQRDSIRLKSDSIAQMRSEILAKLAQFQEAEKLSDSARALRSAELSLAKLYEDTGFFMLPLRYDSQYGFLCLFNFNYYSSLPSSDCGRRGNRAAQGSTRPDQVNGPSMPRVVPWTKGTDPFAGSWDDGHSQVFANISEKLKVLSKLPFKPLSTSPDLELKLLLFFDNSATTSDSYSDPNFNSDFKLWSSSSGGSRRERARGPAASSLRRVESSSLKRTLDTDNNSPPLDSNPDNVLVDLDLNMNVDLYSLKNTLRMVLYAPNPKESLYYEFKRDLVRYFNLRLNSEFALYLEDIVDGLPLLELLKTATQIVNALNPKFVQYLTTFSDLVSLSNNCRYYAQSTPNSTLKGHLNGSKRNEGTPVQSSTGHSHLAKVLKLMLVFKNNMPCLWCNVHFDFPLSTSAPTFPGQLKATRAGLVSDVRFEFVHNLKNSQRAAYSQALENLNRLTRAPNCEPDLVELVKSALSSQGYLL